MPTSFDRITTTPGFLGGRACIRDTRVPVSVVLDYLAGGASVEQVLGDYPELELEDLRQALAYATSLVAGEAPPLVMRPAGAAEQQQPRRRALHVELTDDELHGLHGLADRWRMTDAETLACLVRSAVQRQRVYVKAGKRLIEYLGEAATLGPGEEEALLRELDGED